MTIEAWIVLPYTKCYSIFSGLLLLLTASMKEDEEESKVTLPDISLPCDTMLWTLCFYMSAFST
jgi:hypothetical protein